MEDADAGGQRALGEYASSPTQGRPAGEAAVVAGGDEEAEPVETSTAGFAAVEETVSFAVTQVNYTVEGSGSDEYPVVHVFGRTPDRERVHVRVHDFRPYFYAPAETVSADELRGYDAITGWAETDADGEPYESIRGTRLVKIFGRTPRDVGQIREDFEHYEADILFPNRFLIDKDVNSGVTVPKRELGDGSLRVHESEVQPTDVTATPRVMTADIEVDDRRGFPEDGEEPIICLTTHDSYRDEYVVWLFEPPDGVEGPQALSGYEPIGEDFDADVRVFDREEGMLAAFVDYVRETDADLMTGWNFTDFDAPYLLDRMAELTSPGHEFDLDVDRLSRVDEVWRSDWQGPNIKGRVVFDLLRAYRSTQFTELESYRLDAVGEQELGVGKERYPGDIGDLWEADPERLLEYNLRDVELCVELDRQQSIVAFFRELASFVGCKLEDAPTAGDAVDMYVLHKAHGEFALPSTGTVESGEEFEGGAVFEPITGVRENVSVLDLASLYPMVMWTVNASPETKVDPDAYDGETYRTPTGQHFKQDPAGMMREMIDELLAEREEKKQRRDEHEPDSQAYERFDRQQQSVKVVMNCFTPDTDVLTPDGVRNIRSLEVGDDVYSLDPETMEMETKPVVETQAYPDYEGELIDIETDKIDFRVTPNHRMLVRKNDKNGIVEDEWNFAEAGDLYDYCHYEMPHHWDFDHEDSLGPYFDIEELVAEYGNSQITVSDGGTKVCAMYGVPNVQKSVDTDTFLEIIAWYITEGSLYKAKTRNYRIKIAQEDDENRAQIASLVDQIVDYYYENERSVSFSSRIWFELLEGLCGGRSANKRIPEIVFRASEAQKRRFLHLLIEGDGDRQPNSWRYSTNSTELRDDLLRLCTHLGLSASYERDSDTWRVYCAVDSKNSFRMYRSGTTSSAEEGVYCVTVAENNTLLAGRNGKYQNIGNSLYGVSGWDRFRLYDKDNAAAVTATGREVIEYTEETVSDLGYDVIYGDSVTGDRPVVVRDPKGIVRIHPIADLFKRANPSDESALVVTADGGTGTTLPGSATRRHLDGWEALSLSPDGEAEWQPVDQVIRKETTKDVVKLQHKFGESVTTRDHSYIVSDNGTLEEVPPSDVSTPLRIPDLPPVDARTSLDLYEILEGYEREYEDGRSVGSEHAERKTKRVHADDEWVWFGHEHHRDQSKTVRVQRHVDLTGGDGRALIRLLAAYVSEGSSSTIETTDSRFGASICSEDEEWLTGLREDYYRLFDNTSVSVIQSDVNDQRTIETPSAGGSPSLTYNDRTLKLQMMNELAAVFFRTFAGQTSQGKKIPNFVYHLPETTQDLFMDVLVEGDGSREFDRSFNEYAARNFDYETTSRQLAAGLSILLTQRGQKHSLKYRDEKDSYTVRTCEYYRDGRDPVLTEVDTDGYVYDLSVAKNGNFVDAVGGIVLHNTDSVMLQIGENSTKEQAIQASFDLQDRINDSYDAFAESELGADEHRFEIEFEKFYRRFFQAGKKKRYAGHVVWKEGKDVDDIDITGFEYQRSDIAPITKAVQERVIEMIVTGEDLETVKEYLHDVIEDFQAGNVSLDDVAIPGGIGKRLDNYDTDTAHVRGAKYANLLLGTNFQRGSKPKRLYLDRVHDDYFQRLEAERDLDPATNPLYGAFKREVSAGDGVICFEYADQVPEEFAVDWDKMLDKTLKGPIARILEALDVSWEEVKAGQEQTGLGNFM